MITMSPADKTYMTDMMACQKDCVAKAKAYLAKPSAGRNADMTAMAQSVVKGCMAEMAKMSSMTGK